jgi:hypothetical protein
VKLQMNQQKGVQVNRQQQLQQLQQQLQRQQQQQQRKDLLQPQRLFVLPQSHQQQQFFLQILLEFHSKVKNGLKRFLKTKQRRVAMAKCS